MTTELTPTVLLAVFLAGFLINRHRSVLLAVIAAVFLGVVAANGWLGDLVHNLVGVLNQIT
jgi:hypothetical protein